MKHDTNKRDSKRKQAIAETTRLMEPGVLGFYTHVEATEVIGSPPGEAAPVNVLSILVAEERPENCETFASFRGEPIRLKSLKSWSFGIKQSLLPVSRLAEVLESYRRKNVWQLSNHVLQVGSLVPERTRFVPCDSTEHAPLNRVLKNNFWNGSHVIEWVDPEKIALKPLLDDPKALLELSNTVHERVPLSLAGLSDRLGNVVVQLPVTILMADFGVGHGNDVAVDVAWHPSATRRSLRVSCEMRFDNVISGYASANVHGDRTVLRMSTDSGEQRAVLWDDDHNVILAATNGTEFFDTVSLNMRIGDPEPRRFTVEDESGVRKPVSVGLSITSAVQAASPDRNCAADWTKQRIYKAEVQRLAAERKFVQYRPDPSSVPSSRTKALEDVRYLLDVYGEHGAWLWDPYLSAQDILDTLFYCPHADADTRALTSRRSNTPAEPFVTSQRATLYGAQSNLRGLRLEYRIRTGQAGWSFHDRFLIFPRTPQGPLAWSLGTSVNSLGRRHHILQRVDDAQLIANAFSDLWDALTQPEHLIWKFP